MEQAGPGADTGILEKGGGGGGSDMNNQQGERAEAFGGPALVHWMIRYITWGVVGCFR